MTIFETEKNLLLSKTKFIVEALKRELNENFKPQVVENIYIPSGNNKGIISKIGNIDSVTLQKEEIKLIDDTFYIPVIATSDCIVDYILVEYLPLSKLRKIEFTRRDHDSYAIQENFAASFKFTFKIAKHDLLSISEININIEEFDKIDIHLRR